MVRQLTLIGEFQAEKKDQSPTYGDNGYFPLNMVRRGHVRSAHARI